MKDETARTYVLFACAILIAAIFAATIGKDPPTAQENVGWRLSSQEAPPPGTPLVGLWETAPGYYSATTFVRVGPEWLADQPGPAQVIASSAPTAWRPLP